MTAITIDSVPFDRKVGQLLLPRPEISTYRSHSTPGVGFQISSDKAQPSQLTLTRYVAAGQQMALRNTIDSFEGTVRPIVEYFNNVPHIYSAADLVTFQIKYARVVNIDMIPAWCGYRLGVYQEFAPAAKVVSQFTVYGVPV